MARELARGAAACGTAAPSASARRGALTRQRARRRRAAAVARARARRARAVVVVVQQLQLLRRVSLMREGAAAALRACRRRPCARSRLRWRFSARASRRSGRRAAGVGALARIAEDDVGIHTNRKLVEFRWRWLRRAASRCLCATRMLPNLRYSRCLFSRRITPSAGLRFRRPVEFRLSVLYLRRRRSPRRSMLRAQCAT